MTFWGFGFLFLIAYFVVKYVKSFFMCLLFVCFALFCLQYVIGGKNTTPSVLIYRGSQ